MASIADSLTSMLGPQVVAPLASQLGESTNTVHRALHSSSAALLAGIAAKADQPGFLSQIFNLVTNPANSSTALASAASNLNAVVPGAPASPLGDLGARFASTIFGPGKSAITDAVGQFSGLTSGKAGTLMAMAAPLVLGVLGKHVRENGSSAGDLGNSLKAEAPALQQFLPPSFRSLLGSGIPSLAATGPATVAAATNRWLLPVVVLAALIICLIWYFNRSKASEEVETPAPATATMPAGFFTLKLPNGVELNVPQNGIENQLAMFIADSSKPVDTTTWFNFDRLTFDTGLATLQSSSQEQLNNVAAILKAYPNVHVKVGGYTDNTGDAAANLKLSEDRAKNVMDALVAAGIDPSRLESKGYGDDHPVGDNATEAGRAQNRRISLLVTQK